MDHEFVSQIPPQSWADPRVEKQSSDIHKTGLFATAPVQAGESVLIWGGAIFSWDDLHAGKAADGSHAALSKDLHYGNPVAEGRSITDFANHSCDPNLWTVEATSWIARRPIDEGEELTIDYSTYWGPEEKETITWQCHCGTSHCRATFTSLDWMRTDLHERYGRHFAPFINDCIRQLEDSHPR